MQKDLAYSQKIIMGCGAGQYEVSEHTLKLRASLNKFMGCECDLDVRIFLFRMNYLESLEMHVKILKFSKGTKIQQTRKINTKICEKTWRNL